MLKFYFSITLLEKEIDMISDTIKNMTNCNSSKDDIMSEDDNMSTTSKVSILHENLLANFRIIKNDIIFKTFLKNVLNIISFFIILKCAVRIAMRCWRN